jgi:hypothetical protein
METPATSECYGNTSNQPGPFAKESGSLSVAESNVKLTGAVSAPNWLGEISFQLAFLLNAAFSVDSNLIQVFYAPAVNQRRAT